MDYISSMQFFTDIINESKINFKFYKILANIISFLFNFRFNKKPTEYALVILNNNKNLEVLSDISNLKNL